MGRILLCMILSLMVAASLAAPGRAHAKKPQSAPVCTLGVVTQATSLYRDRYASSSLEEAVVAGETIPILSHDGVICRTVDSQGNDAFVPRSAVSLVRKLGRLDVLSRVWALEPGFDEEGTQEYQRWLRLYDRVAYKDRGGELPPSQGSYDSALDSTPLVQIHNGTDYRITVTYSGPSARSLTLGPGQSGSVSLPAGTYRVTASAHSGSVRPFAGTEALSSGYRYMVRYTIRTVRIR
jgi:hypothetical protein